MLSYVTPGRLRWIKEDLGVKRADPLDAYLGARLRLRRKEIGQTQAALADVLGVTFQQVQKYEMGQARLSASRLYEAARSQGVSVCWYFEAFADPRD